MSHRNRRVTIVYHRIEFVTWISSVVVWNLSHGYRLSPHRICHVDIVYCHIVIVYRHIDVVICSSSHSATFKATVLHDLEEPINTAVYADYSVLHNLYAWTCVGLINRIITANPKHTMDDHMHTLL